MSMTEQEKELFKEAGGVFADSIKAINEDRLTVILVIENGAICSAMADGQLNAQNLLGLIKGASLEAGELMKDEPQLKAEFTFAALAEVAKRRMARQEKSNGISDLLN